MLPYMARLQVWFIYLVPRDMQAAEAQYVLSCVCVYVSVHATAC